MTQKAKFELSAGGLVYKKEDSSIKILMIRAFGKWSLPKGVVGREKKEGMVEAAQREIAEETGISKICLKQKIGEIKYMYRLKGMLIFKKVDYFLFEASGVEKTKPQAGEVEEVGWFTADEALHKIAFKNTAVIIKKGLELIKQYG